MLFGGEGLGDESSSIHLQEIGIHLPSTAIRGGVPLRLERGETDATLAHRMGEGLGVRAMVSSSIHLQEIGIHIQSIAIRNRAIAADSRATRSYIRATAADNREIGIYSQEIASYSREIAADSQEMAVNSEEIAFYRPRNAAVIVGTAESSGISTGTISNSMLYAKVAPSKSASCRRPRARCVSDRPPAPPARPTWS